jgi:hypothetical protein
MVLTGLVRRDGAGDLIGSLGRTRRGSWLLGRDGSSGESGRASCWVARLSGRVDGR